MYTNQEQLIELVDNLIDMGKEGDYWDFKLEWHEDISDLIKDIVCFTNTFHDKDCFIVFGIDDNLNVLGISNIRRKQSDIIDCLVNCHFSGDVRPKISVEAIMKSDKVVDILIIHNLEQTPVFLRQSRKNMKSGCIYMRTGDKNTPDNGNADLPDIEMLWKKRFGLLKPPLDQIFDRMQNKFEWAERNEFFYNIYRPEFSIEIFEDDTFSRSDEFYSHTMCDSSMIFSKLIIKYHQVVLKEFFVVYLDGARYLTPTPEWGIVKFITSSGRINYPYKYYIEDSELYLIHLFLYDRSNQDQKIARDCLFEVVLLYHSIQEKKSFESFLNNNQNLIDEYFQKTENNFSYIKAGNKTNDYVHKLHIGIVFNKLLQEFRISDHK